MFFNRKLILVLLAVLGIVIISGIIISIKSNNTYLRASSWVEHTHEVLFESEQLSSTAKDIQISSRNYVLTGDKKFLTDFGIYRSVVLAHLHSLKILTSDNYRQQVRFDSLALLLQKRIAFSTAYMKARDTNGRDAAFVMITTGYGIGLMQQILNLVNEVEHEENLLLEKRRTLTRYDLHEFQSVFYVLLGTALILLVVIIAFFQHNTQLQKKVNKRTEEISYILERIVEGFVIVDKEFCFNYVNRRVSEMFSREPNSFKGKKVWDLFSDSENDNRRLYNRAMQEQRNFHNSGFYPSLNLWLEIHVYPAPNGLFLFIRDITDARKAEQEIVELNENLAKSASRFRGLIENSYDMVSIVGTNFKPVYRSPSAFKITGWTDEEMENHERIDLTHPDDIESLKTMMAFLLKNPATPYSLSFRTRHKDGHYLWMEGVATNMSHENAIGGIVANFREVTKAKEAEDRLIRSEKIYKTIASSIPGSVIILLDTEFRFLLIEGDMLEKAGYSKEKLLGNKFKDVVTLPVFEESRKEFEKVLKGETVIREAHRGDIDFISRYVPLKDENNIVYAILIAAIDITQLKDAERSVIELNHNLEDKIAERTEDLRKTNEELEAFSYSVSHDLRAPLRAISGYSSIITEDYAGVLDSEGMRMLNAIRQNAKKMGALVDDLLSFSRLGKKDISKAFINMNELTENVVAEFAGENISDTIITIHPLMPAYADYPLMKQVMINLVSNAIKYSSEKEAPVIEIRSQQKDGEIIYSVTDNGAGFDMKYADKLFGVFQRLHSNEEFEGTGIGLAIIKRIVLKHDGRVWAEGVVGKGATFYFSLPVPE